MRNLGVLFLLLLVSSALGQFTVKEHKLANASTEYVLRQMRQERSIPEGVTITIFEDSNTMQVSGEERAAQRVLARVVELDKPREQFVVQVVWTATGDQRPPGTSIATVDSETASATLSKSVQGGTQTIGFRVTPRRDRRAGVVTELDFLIDRTILTLPFLLTANSEISFANRQGRGGNGLFLIVKDLESGRTRQAQVPETVWGRFLNQTITVRTLTPSSS